MVDVLALDDDILDDEVEIGDEEADDTVNEDSVEEVVNDTDDDGLETDDEDDEEEEDEEPQTVEMLVDLEKITIMNHCKKRTFVQELPVEQIQATQKYQYSRQLTRNGLTKSVADFRGIMTPLEVMKVTNADGTTTYQLLSGLRRLRAIRRNGYTTAPAFVWEFDEEEYGRKNALLLSLLMDKKTYREPIELWELQQSLEEMYGMTFAQMEILITEFQPGDPSMLKEVMNSGYDKAIDGLASGKKTIKQAYNMLIKLRKEQMKAEESGEVEEEIGIGSDTESYMKLSEEEVNELLGSQPEYSTDDDELYAYDIHKGTVQNRHALPEDDGDGDLAPETKDQIKKRDENLCRICDSMATFHLTPKHEDWLDPMELHIDPERQYNQDAHLGQLTVHHVIPASVGGTDDKSNLITLCYRCHDLLHKIEKSGTFPTEKDRLARMSKDQQVALLGAFYFAQKAMVAKKQVGMTRKQAQEHAAKSGKRGYIGQPVSTKERIEMQQFHAERGD